MKNYQVVAALVLAIINQALTHENQIKAAWCGCIEQQLNETTYKPNDKCFKKMMLNAAKVAQEIGNGTQASDVKNWLKDKENTVKCDLQDETEKNIKVSDAEFKRIGSCPSVTVIVCCSLLSFVILLVIAALVWKYVRIKKKRKGVTQTKDFDHHHHHVPIMMNGNGVLYEDLNLTHARPRPPIAPPSIEMMDVTHPTLGSNGNPKMDFSYFLNPPPIYEELPDHSDRNNGHPEDEFAENELSVIDFPITHDGLDPNAMQGRYHNHKQFSSSTAGRNSGKSRNAQSLTRKRPSRGSSNSGSGSGSTTGNGGGSVFKSQSSLDRRSRNNLVNNGGMAMGGKYDGTATNPRGYSKHNMGMEDNHMLILSNPSNGMTMKIPPHLVAVLAESCNGGACPYEIIPTSVSGGHSMSANPSNLVVGNSVLVNGGVNGVNGTGIYPSSRSSGSSYGEGGSSSNGSARNNPGGNSIENSYFDSGIGPHSISSFINSPAYDQSILPPSYPMNAYEYGTGGQMNQAYLTSQHPSSRRLRMTVVDRDHPLNPLYSNHMFI